MVGCLLNSLYSFGILQRELSEYLIEVRLLLYDELEFLLRSLHYLFLEDSLEPFQLNEDSVLHQSIF